MSWTRIYPPFAWQAGAFAPTAFSPISARWTGTVGTGAGAWTARAETATGTWIAA